MNRRKFLKTSVASGAALSLGFYYVSQGKNPIFYKKGESTIFTPSPFIEIDSTGKIVLYNHRPDLGQGTFQAMPALIAEELEVEMDQIEIKQAELHEKYGNQLIAGSRSVKINWESLRKLGAATREMLEKAAAQKWQVKPEECYAEAGKIFLKKDQKKSFTYAELVETALTLEVPENPQLKAPKDFKILGKPQPRPDVPAKSKGSTVFGIDVKVEGKLYASVKRAPVLGAKVKEFDAEKALAIPGVKQVLTVERKVFKHTFYGVAVVAESNYAALQGRKALEVKWDTEGVKKENSEQIFENFRKLADQEGHVDRDEGNFEEAITQAQQVLEADYETPFLSHSAIEPLNATAHVREDACEIWASFQGSGWLLDEVAKMTGLKKEQVKVNLSFLGGGFGRKALNDFVLEAVTLSQAVKAPVQVIWTREDDTTQGPFRPASLNRLKGALDEEGRPVAFQHKIIAPSINYHNFPTPKEKAHEGGVMRIASDHAYEIPNLRSNHVLAETNIPICWWRSVYCSTNTFGHECFVDEMALAAKQDPLEFRLNMLKKSPRHTKVLEMIREKSGWDNKLPEGWGKGLAIAESFDTICAHVIKVAPGQDKGLEVKEVFSVIDCGMTINPDNIVHQTVGNVIMGLTAATKDPITFEDGQAVQDNFHNYRLLRFDEVPEIQVHIMKNEEAPGGVGEPGLPPVAPALANAIFDATQKRIRKLPLKLEEI